MVRRKKTPPPDVTDGSAAFQETQSSSHSHVDSDLEDILAVDGHTRGGYTSQTSYQTSFEPEIGDIYP